MEKDDRLRSNLGVVACLRAVDNDRLRLIFDDVQSHSITHPVDWKTKNLFTFNDYPEEAMSKLKLSKEDFAMIGENLVLRLLVLEGKLDVSETEETQ